MKIIRLNYQAVKNLGNYESERLEASADVEEGEDPKDAALKLRRWVNLMLDAPPSSLMGKPQEDPPIDSPEDSSNPQEYPF